MKRIDVDLNSRTWEGLVRAGEEDVQGDERFLAVGQHVLAWQSDDDLVADAIVERVDPHKRMFYLRVKWDTLRADTAASSSMITWQRRATSAEATFGRQAITPVGAWNAALQLTAKMS